MDNIKENITKAYSEAKQHVLKTCPEYTDLINSYQLFISDYEVTGMVALSDFREHTISIFTKMVISQEFSEMDLYYTIIHEFAHVLQKKHNYYSAEHGKVFEKYARMLGLKNPTPFPIRVGHPMYVITMAEYDKLTNRTYKKDTYVTQEWIEEHPEYRFAITKEITEP